MAIISETSSEAFVPMSWMAFVVTVHPVTAAAAAAPLLLPLLPPCGCDTLSVILEHCCIVSAGC
jgi:hypothetical protein